MSPLKGKNGGYPYLFNLSTFLPSEKKVNSAALRKAAKEARQAEIERAREVIRIQIEEDFIMILPYCRLPN